jgi:hypothetical protein
MRLAFYLVYIFGGSTPVYGRRNEVIGRTQHIPFFRGQALRLPDDGQKRNEVIEAVRLASDAITMPVQRIVVEDSGLGTIVGEFDSDKFDVVPKSRVVTQTQNDNQEPKKASVKPPATASTKSKKATKKNPSRAKSRDIEGDIALLIKNNGPLTIEQIADFLAESRDAISACVKDPDRFNRNGDFFDIIKE